MTADQRAKITNSYVPLAKKDYPIVLINYPGESVILANWSRCNKAQCDFTLSILRSIGTLVQNLTAAITTYYSGDTDYLYAKMEDDKRNANLRLQYDYFHSIEITTVSAFIGGEADINIIVTDVNGQRPNVDEEEESIQLEAPAFIFEDHIGTVAISRGIHAIIVVGNMDYLASEPGSVLTKFIQHATTRAPILNGVVYQQMIQQCGPGRQMYDNEGYMRGLVNYPGRSIIARCEQNQNAEWYTKLGIRRI